MDSNNKVLNWVITEGTSLSSVSYSGKYSLHWKQNDQALFNYQVVIIEKNYQYEACAYIKLINITNVCGFQMSIQIDNKTGGIYEFYRSKIFFGNCDWQEICFTTGVIKKESTRSFLLGIFNIGKIHKGGEIYVDDISLKKINFTITIKNDRDEVYDTLNVIYRIIGKEDYNLNDFDLITRIKDNKTTFYEEKTKISSLFFTNQININKHKLNLKDNNFYQAEGILKNKKDNTTDISFYTFKKINKIKRNVTSDK